MYWVGTVVKESLHHPPGQKYRGGKGKGGRVAENIVEESMAQYTFRQRLECLCCGNIGRDVALGAVLNFKLQDRRHDSTRHRFKGCLPLQLECLLTKS